MFILAQFATERPGRLRAMTARTRQFYYVDTLTSTLLTATVSARRYGLSASTIHNSLRKKSKLSYQCGPPLIGQTMTRRHRLAYVQWARCHFIWQFVDWNRISFSDETRFALSNAGGKTHQQALLGLLCAGKGSIWWGQIRGLGWKKG